ncbi:hypothetical protein PanWU01x14_232630 [Parasponia andersonii]|uniref:Uncharacterized protein n=1 Tax=Parasponia andersonii TaxID=3476 RepID=A0A2P5BJN2_PARAD|nr:hypothetical protein PanWU01x14_232630 [Parasponia andersonii]
MWWSAEDLQQREHQVLSNEESVKRTAASNHSDEQDLSSVGKDSNDVFWTLDYTPKKSHVAETKALLVSPDLQQREHQVLSNEESVKRTAASNHSDEQDLSSEDSGLRIVKTMTYYSHPRLLI